LSSKILLTGGAGFIGAHLAKRLLEFGYELDIVDNLARGVHDAVLKELLLNKNARFHSIDLMAPNALKGLGDDFDFVIHLAAIVGVQNVIERPYQTLRDNVSVHEAAIAFASRQTNLRRLVFTSTSEVYAVGTCHLAPPFPTPEDVPLALPSLTEPRTAYMLSKIYGEAMLAHSGMPYTIVRPHNVYGPRMGMAHVIPQLLERAFRTPEGSALKVYSPDHMRTFCFIEDAVEMLMRLLANDAAKCQVVNLGSETPEYKMRRVAQIVIATVGKNLSLDEGPPTPGSPARRAPMMARMTELTGFTAQVSLEEGVEKTFKWYRRNIFS
jgi:nucleoside-diphosphate-sugar epimerase